MFLTLPPFIRFTWRLSGRFKAPFIIQFLVTPSLLISKKKKPNKQTKNLHNCNLLVFIPLNILDQGFDFPILDRNLIVLFFYICYESVQMDMHRLRISNNTCRSSRKLSLNTVYGPWEETIHDFNQVFSGITVVS